MQIEQQQLILTQCYDDFTHKRWDKIEQKLGWTSEQVHEVIAELVKRQKQEIAYREKAEDRLK